MLNELMELLKNPLVIKVLVGYWVFSAFIGKMPSPAVVQAAFAESGRKINPITFLFYQWLFAGLHGLSGNLDRAAVAFKVPGAKEGE
jgi:hypothetical protein